MCLISLVFFLNKTYNPSHEIGMVDDALFNTATKPVYVSKQMENGILFALIGFIHFLTPLCLQLYH